jgi:hypothetical protein
MSDVNKRTTQHVRKAVAVAAAALFSLYFYGWATSRSRHPGFECWLSSQCIDGLSCVRNPGFLHPSIAGAGTCARSCRSQGDCPNGEECFEFANDGPLSPVCIHNLAMLDEEAECRRRCAADAG